MARRTADLSVAETRALLASSEGQRRARMASQDMICLSDAAQLAGATPAMLHQWIKEGQAIGLEWQPGDWRLPAWQFEPPVWELLESLASDLGAKKG